MKIGDGGGGGSRFKPASGGGDKFSLKNGGGTPSAAPRPAARSLSGADGVRLTPRLSPGSQFTLKNNEGPRRASSPPATNVPRASDGVRLPPRLSPGTKFTLKNEGGSAEREAAALRRGADQEITRLKRQLAAAGAMGEIEEVRSLNALLGNRERLETYVGERAQLGLMYDAQITKAEMRGGDAARSFLAQAGSREAFVNGAQAYRAAYAVEYHAQAEVVETAARAGGKDPQAARADAALIDARAQLALLYREAETGKSDPTLAQHIREGNLSLDQFMTAGLERFEAKRVREKANEDLGRALREMNPSLPPSQAAADARDHNALFYDIADSQDAFRKKIDAFDAMPSYYRGASRLQVGYDDIYAQKDEIGRQYNAINGKFYAYEDLVRTGEGSTSEAKALETEIRGMLAKADELSHRSIDASLGRAATVGPVVDLATDVIVTGASTFIPGGWALAGGFSTFKAGLRGEVHDLGDGVMSFAKGAAFAKLGALGKAGTFTEAGTALAKAVGLQGAKWAPRVAAAVVESGATGLASASLTAVDLARKGELDGGAVLGSGLEGFAFGIANAGVRGASTRFGQSFLASGAGAGLPAGAGRALDVLSGGLSEAAGDALTQLAQNRTIDVKRVLLAGLAGAGTTFALSRASHLESKGRRPSPPAPADEPPKWRPAPADTGINSGIQAALEAGMEKAGVGMMGVRLVPNEASGLLGSKLFPTKPEGAKNVTLEQAPSLGLGQAEPTLSDPFLVDKHGRVVGEQLMLGGAKPVLQVDGTVATVVSDVDIAYAVWPDGRPLTDAEVNTMLRPAINAAFGEGGPIVNHGSHMEAIDKNPQVNLAYGLDGPKYWDKDVVNVTSSSGYMGSTPLGETYKFLYDKPDYVPLSERGPQSRSSLSSSATRGPEGAEPVSVRGFAPERSGIDPRAQDALVQIMQRTGIRSLRVQSSRTLGPGDLDGPPPPPPTVDGRPFQLHERRPVFGSLGPRPGGPPPVEGPPQMAGAEGVFFLDKNGTAFTFQPYLSLAMGATEHPRPLASPLPEEAASAQSRARVVLDGAGVTLIADGRPVTDERLLNELLPVVRDLFDSGLGSLRGKGKRGPGRP